MEDFKIHCDAALRDAVLKICRTIQTIGGRALLVGGCVRDAVQNIPNKDVDIECYGVSAEAIRKNVGRDFALDLVGMSFGVFKAHHFDIDIALPRTENKTGAGHKGFMVDCVPGLSFAEAAARRDFTLNAMMYDPLTGELIDPWHGLDDLRNGILRHVSEHFSEDPLRVLRAMQFSARFGFTVAPETVELSRTISQDELPVERLASEWEKLLLKGKKPSLGLKFLRDCGWVNFYPELAALIGCEQNPAWHPEGDVWNHTLLALDETVKLRSGDKENDLVLALVVLCHDFGKPLTRSRNEAGEIISHGHDEAGEAPTRSFLARVWRSPELIERVVPLVTHHMTPSQYVKMDATDRAFRRLALAVGRMDLLRKVGECDILSSSSGTESRECRLARMRVFQERADSLNIRREPPKPLLLGRHLLERGFHPGPAMGTVLKQAFEAQLDGEFTDLDEGLVWLDRFLKKE